MRNLVKLAKLPTNNGSAKEHHVPDFMGSVRTIKHKLHFHMKWVRQYGASQAARQEGIPLQCRGPGFNPWVENIPWRREWPPAPAFLSGEFHGQRSLVGYNPQGHTEAHMTEVTDLAHTQISIVQDIKKKNKKKFKCFFNIFELHRAPKTQP